MMDENYIMIRLSGMRRKYPAVYSMKGDVK